VQLLKVELLVPRRMAEQLQVPQLLEHVSLALVA
jgi:hypothetical protein